MIIKTISKAMDMMPRSGKKSAFNLARRLGWLSIGLGLFEVAAPHRVARMIGVRDAEPVIAAYGLRELAAGIAALSLRNPAPAIWARAGGDALDIGSLAVAAPASRRRLSLGFVLAAVSLITAVDLICARTLSADMKRAKMGPPDYSGRSGFPKRKMADGLVARDRAPYPVHVAGTAGH
jgi:hypothetical protein